MTDFYSNLPQKEKDNLTKSIESLTQNQYIENFELNPSELDAAIGFFVKRGFDREPAEEIAYIILKQAKIDSVPSQKILDELTKSSPATLSELISIILNANRYKTSRLGVRSTLSADDYFSRNIIA